MKNLREIKTTIIGAVLFLVGIAWFVVNFKTLNTFDYSQLYVPGGFLGLGISFLLAPDSILGIMFGWISKFIPSKNGNGTNHK